MKLSYANLPNFDGVKVPQYDPILLSAGIVHIGLGNFHRAHQAWYLHCLMNKGLDFDWAIVGAGVRSNDEMMRQKLESQDYLTTLIELSPEHRSAEIVASMIGFAAVDDDNAALIAAMTNPSVRIVTTTVTEGGYYIDAATKGFDANHADIVHDANNPTKPKTAFGAIIAALKNRRDNGDGPFTCQSCDNVQGNGDIMRQTIVSLAQLSEPDLADWIDTHCTFPNSMVDSIVPATGPKELALVQTFGINDKAPVTHENFRQWVIEDKFCAGRPQWEKVGVIITDDVHLYEHMKIRILNGGHQLIAAVGDLLGIETISAAMNHELIGALFKKVEHEEIMPHVEPVVEFTVEAYIELIEKRFQNEAIIDTTRRVAFDGSSRQPGFVLPSVRDCLSIGIAPNGLALISAIWAHYCAGIRVDGSEIEANDPNWAELNVLAKKAAKNPQLWLENTALYGELKDQVPFNSAFVRWLAHINEEGLIKTLQHYLGE